MAAHHFMLIVKGPDSVWRNMDHTSSSFRRRAAITDWSRVFRVEADATLVAEAKAKLGRARRALAAGQCWHGCARAGPRR